MGCLESKEESVASTEATSETSMTIGTAESQPAFGIFAEFSEIFANPQETVGNTDAVDCIPKGFTTTEWLLLILVLMVMSKIFLSIFKLLQKEILEDNGKYDVEKIIISEVCKLIYCKRILLHQRNSFNLQTLLYIVKHLHPLILPVLSQFNGISSNRLHLSLFQ